MAKKCPKCGRDMHKAYGGWICGICAYEPEEHDRFCCDCKYWHRLGIDYSQGVCDNLVEVDGREPGDDFGCIMWEKKGEQC